MGYPNDYPSAARSRRENWSESDSSGYFESLRDRASWEQRKSFHEEMLLADQQGRLSQATITEMESA